MPFGTSYNWTDHGHVRQNEERDETGMRKRRDYTEIRDTPAFAIIQLSGGPRAFPELTDRQRARLAEKEQQHEREAHQSEVIAGEKARTLTRKAL
jgi:hypothetical protein